MPSERKEVARPAVETPKRGPSVVCPVCHSPRPKSRTWALYCSDKCRKTAYLIRHSEITPADIRATLSRIESALGLLADLNLDQRIRDIESQLKKIIGGGK